MWSVILRKKGGGAIEMRVDVHHHVPEVKVQVIHKIFQPVHFNWKIGRPQLKKRREGIMIEIGCTNEEKVPVSISPVTLAGNPVALDGAIQVTVQSGDGSVEMVDSTSFFVVSGLNPGDTAFLVSGDADLGAGVETISDVILLHVAGAKASNLGMVAGPAVLK